MSREFVRFYEKYRQVLLYIFFGGCTTLISVGSFILFDSVLGINELVANIFSWVLAVGVAYITNRKWVFQSCAEGKAVGKEVLAFYSGRLVTLGIEEGLLLVFVTWLAWNSTAVKIAAQVAVLVGNFLISKFIIFPKKEQ